MGYGVLMGEGWDRRGLEFFSSSEIGYLARDRIEYNQSINHMERT